MALGALSQWSEGELRRWLDQQPVPKPKELAVRLLPEVDDDPPAPKAGVALYCIADNGSGKREARALFPTGSPIAIVTEL